MSGIAFQNVAGLKPKRSRFDWQFSKKFDTDFGWIIPIFTRYCIPGDWFNINLSILLRCLPLIAPVIHRGQIKTDFFFCPDRIVDDCNSRPGTGNPYGDQLILGDNQPPANRFNEELFKSGGFNGTDAQTQPRWNPTPTVSNTVTTQTIGDTDNPNPTGFGVYTLWDYLQFPTDTSTLQGTSGNAWSSAITPLDKLRRMYNFIFNEYYRDETLWTTNWVRDPNNQYRTPTGTYTVLPWDNEQIQFSAYTKDYFTSALPFQQRGISPALPLSGNLGLDFSNSVISSATIGNAISTVIGVSTPSATNPNLNSSWLSLINSGSTGIDQSYTVPGNNPVQSRLVTALNKGTVNLADGLTYDIADFRLAFQMQKWLERNARAGVRYNEYIKAHFGKSIGDESLWRPQYIGGTRSPIIFSEVLQTSQTATTPQGNLGGHGISASSNHVGKYECDDYGYIIGLLRVMPDPAYASQGFKRTELYETRYDIPIPEFVNLSEQDITQAEIFIASNSTDTNLFGYQGMYDELRTAEDHVCGAMRSEQLDFWHMNRIFKQAPLLNRQFIECNSDRSMRRIFFEQTQPGLIIDCEFDVSAVRPIPAIAEPGLIDHH
jgi:hypothetical protein